MHTRRGSALQHWLRHQRPAAFLASTHISKVARHALCSETLASSGFCWATDRKGVSAVEYEPFCFGTFEDSKRFSPPDSSSKLHVADERVRMGGT